MIPLIKEKKMTPDEYEWSDLDREPHRSWLLGYIAALIMAAMVVGYIFSGVPPV